MVTRDFDAFLAEKAGVRPTFRVGGQDFTMRAKLPFKKFAKLVGAVSEDEDEIETTEKFFRMVLVPADRDRFMALLDAEAEDDDAEVISPEQVGELMEWAMGFYTGKQPASSDGSPPGASTTGPQRNVVSLNSRSQAG